MFRGASEKFIGGREVQLEVTYFTNYGENLLVSGTVHVNPSSQTPNSSDQNEDSSNIFQIEIEIPSRRMEWNKGHCWSTTIQLPPGTYQMEYHYSVWSDSQNSISRKESCRPHVINFSSGTRLQSNRSLKCIDRWDFAVDPKDIA